MLPNNCEIYYIKNPIIEYKNSLTTYYVKYYVIKNRLGQEWPTVPKKHQKRNDSLSYQSQVIRFFRGGNTKGVVDRLNRFTTDSYHFTTLFLKYMTYNYVTKII